MAKSPPANVGSTEEAVQPLGGEDLLERGRAVHPSILAWEVLWNQFS